MSFNSLVFCFYLMLIYFSAAFYNSGYRNVFGYPRICLCRCGRSSKPDLNDSRHGRLLGGNTIPSQKFPWLALINTEAQTFGGSLLSDRHVITAASLIYRINIASIIITLGAHNICGAQETSLNTTVESVAVHSGFSSVNFNNDIALLKTRHVVPFSQYISPICLPVHDLEFEKIAWVPSWMTNSTTSCTPRVTSFPILSSRSCSRGSMDFSLFTSDKGCLGPLGHKGLICKADVGAPVMIRLMDGAPYRLVGVISSASCDDDSPPLYTKVFEHTSWIRQQIRNDCQCL